MGRPRSSKTAVGKIFDSAAVPVYLLDAGRRVAYCNPACAEWLGATNDEDVVGRRCDFHSDHQSTDSDATVAVLCPPLEAFEGQSSKTPVGNVGDSRPANIIPICDAESGLFHVLVIVSNTMQMSETDSIADDLHEHIRSIRHQMGCDYSIDRIVGVSRHSELIRRQIRSAATSRSNVAIIGPRGSGRETIARTIHYCENDPSLERTLLPLTCELLDTDLLSSMLDAFEKSTNQRSDPQNTLLLLNVDRLPPGAQTTLADFLSKREQLQVLATASNPLMDNFKGDEFISRQLASIISTMTIVIPTLSTRLEDIPMLAQCAIEQQNALGGKQISRVSQAALEQLGSYNWPGDVRELFAIVAEAHQNAAGLEIGSDDLPERIRLARDAEMYAAREIEKIELDSLLAGFEAELIIRALNLSSGNKTRAAELLGINRARLLRRIEQLRIDGKT